MIIRIKFCGGCNPRHDRREIADRLKAEYGDLEFTYDENAEADAAVIICGCNAACARTDDIKAKKGFFILRSPDEWDSLVEFLGL